MATRSLINVKCTNGKIRSIYCHWDGADHLPILQKHYGTQELAEKLVSLGDLSGLAESCECPEGHSYDSAIKGYCVYYHRDRGDSWERHQPLEFDSFEEAADQNCGQQYIYEFDGNNWTQTEL